MSLPTKDNPDVSPAPGQPQPDYSIVIGAETWGKIKEYKKKLIANPQEAGDKLQSLLGVDGTKIAAMDDHLFVEKLLELKKGGANKADEMKILGGIGITAKVSAQDDMQVPDSDGNSRVKKYDKPLDAELLFANAAMFTQVETDKDVLNADGSIKVDDYKALMKERLAPLLQHANDSSNPPAQKACVRIQGLGAGLFASNPKDKNPIAKARGKEVQKLTNELMQEMLGDGKSFPNIGQVQLSGVLPTNLEEGSRLAKARGAQLSAPPKDMKLFAVIGGGHAFMPGGGGAQNQAAGESTNVKKVIGTTIRVTADNLKILRDSGKFFDTKDKEIPIPNPIKRVAPAKPQPAPAQPQPASVPAQPPIGKIEVYSSSSQSGSEKTDQLGIQCANSGDSIRLLKAIKALGFAARGDNKNRIFITQASGGLGGVEADKDGVKITGEKQAELANLLGIKIGTNDGREGEHGLLAMGGIMLNNKIFPISPNKDVNAKLQPDNDIVNKLTAASPSIVRVESAANSQQQVSQQKPDPRVQQYPYVYFSSVPAYFTQVPVITPDAYRKNLDKQMTDYLATQKPKDFEKLTQAEQQNFKIYEEGQKARKDNLLQQSFVAEEMGRTADPARRQYLNDTLAKLAEIQNNRDALYNAAAKIAQAESRPGQPVPIDYNKVLVVGGDGKGTAVGRLNELAKLQNPLIFEGHVDVVNAPSKPAASQQTAVTGEIKAMAGEGAKVQPSQLGSPNTRVVFDTPENAKVFIKKMEAHGLKGRYGMGKHSYAENGQSAVYVTQGEIKAMQESMAQGNSFTKGIGKAVAPVVAQVSNPTPTAALNDRDSKKLNKEVEVATKAYSDKMVEVGISNKKSGVDLSESQHEEIEVLKIALSESLLKQMRGVDNLTGPSNDVEQANINAIIDNVNAAAGKKTKNLGEPSAPLPPSTIASPSTQPPPPPLAPAVAEPALSIVKAPPPASWISAQPSAALKSSSPTPIPPVAPPIAPSLPSTPPAPQPTLLEKIGLTRPVPNPKGLPPPIPTSATPSIGTHSSLASMFVARAQASTKVVAVTSTPQSTPSGKTVSPPGSAVSGP